MPLLKKLKPDVEAKLVFTESWRGGKKSHKEEFPDFNAYDISCYGTNSLYKVIRKERPDIVLTLNNYFLLDKAINVFCRKLHVPVVYLSHGKLSGREVARSLPSYKRSAKKPPKINRDNFYILSNYLKSTILAGKPWRFIKSFWALATKPGTMLSTSSYTDELQVDKNLVYFNSCKDVMVKERGFPSENIYVIGNPEFDSFINAPVRDLKIVSPVLAESPSYILYLEDGMIQSGILSREQWVDHMKDVNRAAKKSGRKLAIKFHPRTDIAPLQDFLEDEGILSFGNDADMKSLIYHSHAVVSIFSTTISFALLLNKNVYSPRWGATGAISRNYPDRVVKYVSSPEDLAELFKGSVPVCEDQQYIRQELSPADGKSVERIIGHLSEFFPQ